jgi:hypothetical protein
VDETLMILITGGISNKSLNSATVDLVKFVTFPVEARDLRHH